MTTYHKLSGLKPHSFIISQFWSEVQWAQPGSLLWVSQGQGRGAGWPWLFSGGSAGEATSSLIQVVGRFQFHEIVGPRSLRFPCCLVSQWSFSASRGCPNPLADDPFHLQSQQWHVESSHAPNFSGFLFFFVITLAISLIPCNMTYSRA